MTRGSSLWAAIGAADQFSVAQREEVTRRLAALELAADPRFAVVETCHRVEVYGTADAAAVFDGDPFAGLTLLRGPDAARHLGRLACGLESAILGEDQVLHQVRVVLSDLCERHADAALIRLFELAVGAGRRARADGGSASLDLGELAVRWLEQRGAVGGACGALVVGTGPMGRLAAAAFARRGAFVTVASRSVQRAQALALSVRGRATDLAGAARLVASSGAVVAIRGPWHLAADVVAEAGAAIVDLSVPHAVPLSVRSAFGERFADVDRVYREATDLGATGAAAPSTDPAAHGGAAHTRRGADAEARSGTGAGADSAFIAIAEGIVEETVRAYGAWSAGRPSVETLRALRERSEEHRAAELRRLLRRLPELDPRSRQLVEAFSERLVASLLHGPSAALREDSDGSAAAAAEQLFGL